MPFCQCAYTLLQRLSLCVCVCVCVCELLAWMPFKLNSAESFSLRTCNFQLNEYARWGMCRHLTLVETRVGGLYLLDKEAPILQVSDVLHQETVVSAVSR